MEPSLLIGLFCWLAAVVVYIVGYRGAARRYDIIFEVPTVAASDIPGLGASMVEVNGVVRCDQPVLSDLARVPCVVFDSSVTEHWTTTRKQADSKGRTRTVTEHHSATRYSNSVRIAFTVHDSDGSVAVDPRGASIDLLDGLNGLDGPHEDSPAFDIVPHHFGGSLRYAESVLPLEQQVYVLGQVGPEHQILQPEGCIRPFIISHRSEATLLDRARWGKRMYALLMVILFVGGVAGLMIGAGGRL